ncbi:MAG: hypothetical protein ABI840_06525 [bacterium]
MDLEKVKKNYKWDPTKGDYAKEDVSYERRMSRRKQLRNRVLLIFYLVLLIVSIIIVYNIS